MLYTSRILFRRSIVRILPARLCTYRRAWIKARINALDTIAPAIIFIYLTALSIWLLLLYVDIVCVLFVFIIATV